MFYYVYKITNIINGKFYIGAHSTSNMDDGYMGSGKLIKRAILKYGIENFKKEILKFVDSKKEMYELEKELVVLTENSYNLKPGGSGGFLKHDNFKGRSHSQKTKDIMSANNSGKNNPMYGRKRDQHGEKAPNYGKKCSEAKRKLLSEKSKSYFENLQTITKKSRLWSYIG
ncbi:hypothetical protein FB_0152 [Escherichia phage vB_EcoM_FB]|nr:hypothetical protein FB_0152 [Escherichia phage vB_EcoM_FB]